MLYEPAGAPGERANGVEPSVGLVVWLQAAEHSEMTTMVALISQRALEVRKFILVREPAPKNTPRRAHGE